MSVEAFDPREREQRLDEAIAAYFEQVDSGHTTTDEEWIERFTLCPVLTIPTDNLDFVRNGTHLTQISARVLDKLHGKEVVVFK